MPAPQMVMEEGDRVLQEAAAVQDCSCRKPDVFMLMRLIALEYTELPPLLFYTNNTNVCVSLSWLLSSLSKSSCKSNSIGNQQWKIKKNKRV